MNHDDDSGEVYAVQQSPCFFISLFVFKDDANMCGVQDFAQLEMFIAEDDGCAYWLSR